MSNYDFFIRSMTSDYDLASSVANLLDAQTDQVLILDEISDVLENDATPIILERRRLQGDYELFVSLYAEDKKPGRSEADFVSEICKELHCFCLFASNSDNPYEWVQVSPEGSQRTVLLKDEPLDERGEAVLCNGG
ncbi:MAG: hypothetical protein WD049_07320 [Candidatus Paceibacterota bacterium]